MRLSSAVAPVQRAFARRSALVATLAIGTSILLSGAGATAAPTPTALQLNGSTQYVTMGAAPGLGAAQFTLETWFKRTGAGVGTSTGAGGITSVLPLVTKGRAEAEGSNVDMNYFLGIDTATNKLAVDFEEGASGASPGLNHPLIGNTVVTSNVWHHAAATYDGTTWRLYLDGAADGSLTVSRPARSDSIQHAALGTAMTSTGAAAGFFQGIIDEARIWNVARTQAQIQASKDAEITSAANLLGRWGLNEGAGSTIGDSTGNLNVGTAVASPSWSSDVPTLTAAPAWNAGLYFTGAASPGSYATFGQALGLGASVFTLETWFKRTGAGIGTSTGAGGITSVLPLVTKGRAEAEGSNVDMNYFLGIDTATNKLAVDFEEGATGGNHPVTGTATVTSNAWHHAAATYDGTTWRLYLDGVLDQTLVVGAFTPRSDSIQHAALGTAMTSNGTAAGFFDGALDEVRIW